MKNKSTLFIIVIVAIAGIAAAAFLSSSILIDRSSGGGGGGFSDESDYEENGIYFDEEDEGADLKKVKRPEEDFYGSWSATSDMASYLYGNFDITIEPGGVWHGNITDEKMTGIWKMEGVDMRLINEWIDVTVAFSESGNLVLQRDNSDEGDGSEFINTVLVKKK